MFGTFRATFMNINENRGPPTLWYWICPYKNETFQGRLPRDQQTEWVNGVPYYMLEFAGNQWLECPVSRLVRGPGYDEHGSVMYHVTSMPDGVSLRWIANGN